MSVGYRVSRDRSLVVERWFGLTAHDELIANREKQLMDSSLSQQINIFADARFAIFESATFDFAKKMREVHRRQGNKNRVGYCAILVSEEDWHKAKAFEAQTEKDSEQVVTFITFESACSWLGADVYDVLNCLSQITLYPKYHRRSSSLFLFDEAR